MAAEIPQLSARSENSNTSTASGILRREAKDCYFASLTVTPSTTNALSPREGQEDILKGGQETTERAQKSPQLSLQPYSVGAPNDEETGEGYPSGRYVQEQAAQAWLSPKKFVSQKELSKEFPPEIAGIHRGKYAVLGEKSSQEKRSKTDAELLGFGKKTNNRRRTTSTRVVTTQQANANPLGNVLSLGNSNYAQIEGGSFSTCVVSAVSQQPGPGQVTFVDSVTQQLLALPRAITESANFRDGPEIFTGDKGAEDDDEKKSSEDLHFRDTENNKTSGGYLKRKGFGCSDLSLKRSIARRSQVGFVFETQYRPPQSDETLFSVSLTA